MKVMDWINKLNDENIILILVKEEYLIIGGINDIETDKKSSGEINKRIRINPYYVKRLDVLNEGKFISYKYSYISWHWREITNRCINMIIKKDDLIKYKNLLCSSNECIIRYGIDLIINNNELNECNK